VGLFGIPLVRPWIAGAEPNEAVLTLLAAAETSGGLLFACPSAAAQVAVAELRRAGHAVATIGEFIQGPPGTLHLR
jgi:hypothetical protein